MISLDGIIIKKAEISLKSNYSPHVKWHPSRLGFFYFAFNNGSAAPCQQGQKLAIKVSLSPSKNSAAAPVPSPAVAPVMPAPTSGGIVSSSPAYPWPFHPHESTPPSQAPSADLPANSPSWPGNGDGIPFINSNPAVPLPTGEVDSATISPLSASGHGGKVSWHNWSCFLFCIFENTLNLASPFLIMLKQFLHSHS